MVRLLHRPPLWSSAHVVGSRTTGSNETLRWVSEAGGEVRGAFESLDEYDSLFGRPADSYRLADGEVFVFVPDLAVHREPGPVL